MLLLEPEGSSGVHTTVARREVPGAIVIGKLPSVRCATSFGGTRGSEGSARGAMRETMSAIERPNRFGYTMTEITGAMKPLVAAADGAWSFAPGGDGVRITWSWDITPKGILGKLGMPIFKTLWAGSARQAFDRIGPQLAG